MSTATKLDTDSGTLTPRFSSTINGVKQDMPGLLMPMAICLCGILVFGKLTAGANMSWFSDAIASTTISIIETLLGFYLFFSVFNGLLFLVEKISGPKKNPENSRLIVAMVMIALIIINSLPVVLYIYLLPFFKSNQVLFRMFYLLFANAMFYSFFYMFVSEKVAESKKIYVQFSWFKGPGHDPQGYLKEAGTWFKHSLKRPLFYYLFSFTLFTEGIAESLFTDKVYRGIVVKLFKYSVYEEGFFSLDSRFWFYFSCMMLIILPVRYIVCDFPLRNWQRRKNLMTS